MPFDAHTNLASSLVATAPSPATSGLSLVVTGGDGALFPTGSFNVSIWPANTQPTHANTEIARATVSTDTFTLVRAQEGTSARTVIVGDQIAATITAKTLTDVENALGEILTVPTTDITLDVNCTATPLEEYVMDATHELVFADPSEMAVLL